MEVVQHISLKPLHTFGMEVQGAQLIRLKNAAEVASILTKNVDNLPLLVLGGGSNMLFLNDMNRFIIKNEIKGIELLEEDADVVILKVGAGEVWDEFVTYAVAHNYCGIENMALIPGTIGAAPMQNIGAYGREVKDVIVGVEYWNLETAQIEMLTNEQCHFGYRDSIFKHELKGKVIITSVTFKLSKHINLNTSYGTIQDELALLGISNPSIADVAKVVRKIRLEKLPNPIEIGNAGSFFKNPTISNAQYAALKAEYPTIPGYAVGTQNTKVPAAWLIEQCGWKGHKEGHVGVHHRQPLVLVHFGDGHGQEIYDLSSKIIDSIQTKFGITLEREVQLYQ